MSRVHEGQRRRCFSADGVMRLCIVISWDLTTPNGHIHGIYMVIYNGISWDSMVIPRDFINQNGHIHGI